VVAFGDDYNDVEMLSECGIGVAMGNAIDECKAVADHICGDCDDDGMAKWLEKNLL
jgi:hydroxymethylpyrimidine pyrophosphatase-like HAD family hydrolase